MIIVLIVEDILNTFHKAFRLFLHYPYLNERFIQTCPLPLFINTFVVFLICCHSFPNVPMIEVSCIPKSVFTIGYCFIVLFRRRSLLRFLRLPISTSPRAFAIFRYSYCYLICHLSAAVSTAHDQPFQRDPASSACSKYSVGYLFHHLDVGVNL